jgi:hypothetical protein
MYGKAVPPEPKLRFAGAATACRAVCPFGVRPCTSVRRGEVDGHAFEAQLGIDRLASQVLAGCTTMRPTSGTCPPMKWGEGTWVRGGSKTCMA